MFIAFEGIDGSGKTTISSMVRDALAGEGYKVFLTNEPTERIQWTEELKRGRDAKSGLSLFFRFTEDRFSHQDEIGKHLDSGEVVLCDRYIMSSLAYQGALIETLFDNRDSAVKWMLEVSDIIRYRPDATIYLDLDPSVSMKRLSHRESLTGFEERKYLDRVRSFYRTIEMDGKITVDGGRSLNEVFHSVMIDVMKILRQ